nr:hypothetical protein [Desulfobacula sp.]
MSDKSKALLNFSEVESKRFGLKVYRGSIEDIKPSAIVDFTLQEGIDVAIIRIPTEKNYCLEKLARTGLPYIVADALVYYQVDLDSYQPNELKNKDLEFVEANLEHKEIIDKIVAETFIGYKNHYSSNSLLDIDLIEAYKEWAQGYYSNKEKDKCAWLVRRKEHYIGFATCAFSGDVSEGVLYGILPGESGGGVYTDLIRFTQQFFKNKGYSIFKTSTQINNYAVQKVWSREGLFLKQSFLTIHINSLMSVSCIKKRL